MKSNRVKFRNWIRTCIKDKSWVEVSYIRNGSRNVELPMVIQDYKFYPKFLTLFFTCLIASSFKIKKDWKFKRIYDYDSSLKIIGYMLVSRDCKNSVEIRRLTESQYKELKKEIS